MTRQSIQHGPATELVLALRRLNSALVATNRAVSSATGIKDGDLAILDTLHQFGPLTPTELARRTSTHLATMTGVLVRLERDGWIRRTPAVPDRRSVLIEATSITRLNDIYAPVHRELAELTRSWPPEQVDLLLNSITAVTGIAEQFATELRAGDASTGAASN